MRRVGSTVVKSCRRKVQLCGLDGRRHVLLLKTDRCPTHWTAVGPLDTQARSNTSSSAITECSINDNFDKKAASPPHADGSIVFARWLQYDI